jgi:hypothetical protein
VAAGLVSNKTAAAPKVGHVLGTAPRPGPDGDQWMSARRLAALRVLARNGGGRATELLGWVAFSSVAVPAVLLAEVESVGDASS